MRKKTHDTCDFHVDTLCAHSCTGFRGTVDDFVDILSNCARSFQTQFVLKLVLMNCGVTVHLRPTTIQHVDKLFNKGSVLQ